MAEDLLLSLKSWPSSDSKDSLPFLISRINEQRGSFRDVTEDRLADEIRSLEAGDGTIEEPNTGETLDVSLEKKSPREELSAARLEIVKQVTQAHMESASALEFISLLLSKHTPVQAQLTLSPHLKSIVPLGSLGAEVTQALQVSDEDQRDDEMVSIGWKMDSLGNTADSLLKSATRLEQDIELETKYWQQVLAIKEEGWSLCRLPREKHTLGVRYGFAEAYSDFRDRGLVALGRDEEGSIKPVRDVRSKSRRLRVRIVQQGELIALDEKVEGASTQEISIAQSILQARNSVFDEELHHELQREARNLANQGVRCIGDAVILPYEVDKQIEIDLVPLGGRDLNIPNIDTSNASSKTSQEDGIIVKSISISLRILLSHAHHENLARRSQLPPPIRETKHTRPIYAILKPILEVLRHRYDIQAMQTFLENLGKAISAANLNFTIGDSTISPGLASLPFFAISAATPATEALVNSLTAPLKSSITVHFPSNLTILKVELYTNFLPPTMGTDYQVIMISSPPASPLASLPHSMHFPSPAALEDYIFDLLTVDLVSLVSTSPAIGGEWTIISPHDGQLIHRKKGCNVARTFTIDVEKYRLSLKWGKVGEGMDRLSVLRWSKREVDNGKGLLDAIEEVLERE